MSKIAFALNEIVLGSGADTVTVAPSTVFDAGENFDELLAMDAVREPTDAELALYKQTAGKAAPAADEPAPAPTTKPAAAKPAAQGAKADDTKDIVG